MGPMKMMRYLCLIVLALSIAIASTTGENTGDVIVPESDFTEVTVSNAKKEKVDVLANIVALKAYCVGAWDDARLIFEQQGRAASIVEFVNYFGQHGGGVDKNGLKGHVENIVTEYADIMAKIQTKYGDEEGGGVNLYILKDLDHAVRTNPKGVLFEKKGASALDGGGDNGRTIGHLVLFDHEALGLESRPRILVRMAVPFNKFLAAKAKAREMANNADALAATLFLSSKSMGQYKSFLTREVAKVQARMRQEFNIVAKTGFKAAKRAFKDAYNADRVAFFKQASVQATASREASDGASKKYNWSPPTYKEMKKIADTNAKEFMKKFAKKMVDPSKLIKELIEEAGGIKLFVSSTGLANAGSTMKPRIKFIGSKADAEDTVRVVPGPSSTFVQHFKLAEPVGKVTKIVLIGTGTNEAWNGQKVRIRVGSKDAEITPFTCGKADSFWLKSGDSIECSADEDAVAREQYNKAQCQGWKQTHGCSGSGKRKTEDDKLCTTPIDSSDSGYCECDEGPRATVDCGHDTFTCNEICAAA